MEYDIDKELNLIEENMHFSINNLFLNKNQVTVLEKYKINYKNCSSMSELLFEIEDYLNDETTENYDDLEMVSFEISEMNYYMNTNK